MKIVFSIFKKGQSSVNTEFVTGTKLDISNIQLDYIFQKAAKQIIPEYDQSAWLKLENMLSSMKRRKNKFNKHLVIAHREKNDILATGKRELPEAD